MKILFAIFFIFLLPQNFVMAQGFDINLSKKTIYIGNIFSGQNVKVYGLLEKNGYDYVIITELGDVLYEIKPKIKNKIGLVKVSSEPKRVKYYGFLNVISNTNEYKQFLKYQPNEILDEFLRGNNLLSVKIGQIKIKNNGLFGEKIDIPKAAKPGKYMVKVYVLEKNTGNIKAIFGDYFDVVLSGDGAFVKKLSIKEKSIYILLSISMTIGISCLVIFLLDFYKNLTSKN